MDSELGLASEKSRQKGNLRNVKQPCMASLSPRPRRIKGGEVHKTLGESACDSVAVHN